MLKKILFPTLFFIIVTSVFSQPPDILWENTYKNGWQAYGYAGLQTEDGGFVAVGHTERYGSYSQNVYLVKTDSAGDTLWTKTFISDLHNVGYDIKQTSDSGYIITGKHVPTPYAPRDIKLLRTDENGELTWEREIQIISDEIGNSVIETDDGGFVITGLTGTDSLGYSLKHIYLLKTDERGDTLWTKIYDYTFGHGNCVIQDDEGNYLIAGKMYPYPGTGHSDVCLIKADANGDTIWTKTYGGDEDEVGFSVHQTVDGGYIAAGLTESFGAGNYDVYLVKTDNIGDTLWTRTFGGISDDSGWGVDQTTDGGYIVVGKTRSNAWGYNDVYLVRTDSSGDTLWTTLIGGWNNDEGESVQQTTDGGFIVCGSSDSFEPTSHSEVYLVRLSAEGNVVEGFGSEQPYEFRLYPAHPNPFNGRTVVSYQLSADSHVNLTIYDITGREVAKLIDSYEVRGLYEVVFDAKDLTSGVYLMRLDAGGTQTGNVKVVLVK